MYVAIQNTYRFYDDYLEFALDYQDLTKKHWFEATPAVDALSGSSFVDV